MKKFEELGIDEKVLDAIKDMNFEKPTEIQEKAIPAVLAGRDIIAESATGSGKTFVFAAGIIHSIKPDHKIQALILTPTRELAEQISDALKKFAKYYKFKITAVYGGVPIERQIRDLRTSDIVVATPGRTLDHISRRTIRLNSVKMIILDEADRMLDMGFIDDVKEIMKNCPKERQTLLLSATITGEILKLKKQFLKNPVVVNAEKQVSGEKLKQEYYEVKGREKISLLYHLLNKSKGLSMIFCNTRNTVDFVSQNLQRYGTKALPIHGGHTQNKRLKSLKDFNDEKVNVLVCTDVAARGLDIKNVQHIFNYDIPKTSKEYVHRIGRTARAGKEGVVINLLSPPDYDNMSRIMRDYREFDIKQMTKPKFEKKQTRPAVKPNNGGFHKSFRRKNNNNRRNNSRRRFRSNIYK